MALAVVGASAGLRAQLEEPEPRRLTTTCRTVTWDEFAPGDIMSNVYVPDMGWMTVYAYDKFMTQGPTNQAMIFDSTNPSGGDNDLHSGPGSNIPESLGNLLIISEDMDASDPDDSRYGGTFVFDLSAIPYVVEAQDLVVVDTEDSGTISCLFPRGGEKRITIPEVTNSYMETVSLGCNYVTKISVQIPGSAALDALTLCMPALPDTTPSGSSLPTTTITGDPHVHTASGHIVDLLLPVGPWVPLLEGPKFALEGHVFSKAQDEKIQWFDGFAVIDKTRNATVFNATIPHDVPTGEAGPLGGIEYLIATLDGNRITQSNKVYTAAGVTVAASKLASAVRGGKDPKYNDDLDVTVGDFGFEVYVARETSRDNYDSLEEQLSLTHLDVRFHGNFDTTKLSGVLVDVIWGDADKRILDTAAEAAVAAASN